MDPAAIEAKLRAHIASERGPRAGFYRRLQGEARFWAGSAAIELHGAEAMDEASECQRVSLRIADTYGFEVVSGWALMKSGELPWHCFNLDPDSGAIVDAARARGLGIGYVGKVLLPHERPHWRSQRRCRPGASCWRTSPRPPANWAGRSPGSSAEAGTLEGLLWLPPASGRAL